MPSWPCDTRFRLGKSSSLQTRRSSLCIRAQGFQDFLEELQRLNVRVLVTSRCTLDVGLQGARQHELSSLPPEAAAELLRQEAGPDQVTQPQAEELAMVCGHNALALKIIGGFIASCKVTAQARS